MPTCRPLGMMSFSLAAIIARASSWAGHSWKGMSCPLSLATIRQCRTNSSSGGGFSGRQLPTRAIASAWLNLATIELGPGTLGRLSLKRRHRSRPPLGDRLGDLSPRVSCGPPRCRSRRSARGGVGAFRPSSSAAGRSRRHRCARRPWSPERSGGLVAQLGGRHLVGVVDLGLGPHDGLARAL